MFQPKVFRLRKPVIATSVDDDERALFREDTALPAGTHFRILRDRHNWPGLADPQHYTISPVLPGGGSLAGGRYVVPAEVLDELMERAA